MCMCSVGLQSEPHKAVTTGIQNKPGLNRHIPGGELFSTVQNRCGQISYSYLVPNSSFNFKDAMCQTVCTRHGLQEGWVFCALHAV